MNNFVNQYIGGYNISNNSTKSIDIYGGNKNHKRNAGDDYNFHMRDILINLKYLDFKNMENDKKRKILFEKINDIFHLSTGSYLTEAEKQIQKTEEKVVSKLQYLLTLSKSEFISAYIRNFRLFSSYSDAAKPLYMVIKKYYELQLEKLTAELDIDLEKYINKWNTINSQNTSSIILCFVIHDKDFLNELQINKMKKLITKLKKWSYRGFCPYEPTVRLTELLEFPLNELLEVLISLDEQFVLDQLEFIDNLQKTQKKENLKLIMKISKIKPIKKKLTRKELENLIKQIVLKLNEVKNELLTWENYYIKHSKNIYPLCSIIEKHIKQYQSIDINIRKKIIYKDSFQN